MAASHKLREKFVRLPKRSFDRNIRITGSNKPTLLSRENSINIGKNRTCKMSQTMTKSETSLMNEFDLHCKTCDTLLIKKGMSAFRNFKFPGEALQGTHDKTSSKPSVEFRKQVDPAIDPTKYENLKLIVEFEDWKPKEDVFDIKNCTIDDIEHYDDFIKCVKACWMTKNMFDLENVAVEKLKRGKPARGPIFCGNCYSKTEKSDPVEIIGWTDDYSSLKPVYIMGDKLIKK